MKKTNEKLLDLIGIGCGVILLIILVANIIASHTVKTVGSADVPDEAVTVTGTALGRNGDVTVEVVATADQIYQIRVIQQEETDGIGSVAVDQLPGAIYEAQSLQVDAIAGATITSEAIKNAVRDALSSAGIDAAAFETAPVALEAAPAEDEVYDVDVVVVGAGGAGMTAAIVAHDAGQSVLVLESQAMVGGNSVRSTGGMNAAKTEWQDLNEFGEAAGVDKQLAAAENYPDNDRIQELAAIVREQWDAYQADPDGYFDSTELFQLDTLIGGGALNDPALVETLTENSEDAIAWLSTIGADLHNVSSFGGASVKRIHRPVNDEGKVVSVGAYIVPILDKNLKDRGIDVLLNTTAEQILIEDGAAVGVVAAAKDGHTVTVNAKSVVLATGGFGGNLDMVTSYRPDLEGFMTTNAPGVQGQGIAMAVEAGADTVDLDQIQIHPTVEANTATLITEGLRGDGAILVNQEGERFYDEVSTRDKVSAAEIAQTGSASWLIIDDKMVQASSVIQGYIKSGLTLSGETYQELAEAIGVPADVFEATMNTWNGYVANKEDPDFGRTSFAQPLDVGPYYAIHVTAGIHHTMGGVKIDSDAQVIDTDGSVIPGLFAAGEVTGGVHGGNRLGGNAVADFTIFGRIAGASAAAYAASGALANAA